MLPFVIGAAANFLGGLGRKGTQAPGGGDPRGNGKLGTEESINNVLMDANERIRRMITKTCEIG
jgi:hypothetical protein